MRRSAVAVVPLVAAALVFVACSERESTSPRLPSGANFSQTLTPATTCDFTQINKAAGQYFTSAQDPVNALITNMKGQSTAAARTPIAWDILRAVAAERLSASTTTGSIGAIFVNDVLRCTTFAFGAGADVDTGFTNNLALVLDQGLFGVRGVGSDATRPAVAMVAGRNAAPPGWGVQPDPSVGTWPTDRGTFLVYGYPTLITGLPVNPATSINGTFNAFELGAVPFGTHKDGMLVGICSQSVSGGNTIANRLTHNLNEIIVNANPAALCLAAGSPPPLLGLQSRSRDALRRFASLFTPATAYASDVDIGGTPSSWSPFSTAALLGSSLMPTFTTGGQPNDAVVGGNVHAAVNVSINGIPVPGVDLTVAIDNNQGAPAGAIITSGDASTHATTDVHGNATFDITIGKPGGYLIAVGGNLTGVTTGGALSAQFHIKNP
jgi:hypothetical protein